MEAVEQMKTPCAQLLAALSAVPPSLESINSGVWRVQCPNTPIYGMLTMIHTLGSHSVVFLQQGSMYNRYAWMNAVHYASAMQCLR